MGRLHQPVWRIEGVPISHLMRYKNRSKSTEFTDPVVLWKTGLFYISFKLYESVGAEIFRGNLTLKHMQAIKELMTLSSTPAKSCQVTPRLGNRC